MTESTEDRGDDGIATTESAGEVDDGREASPGLHLAADLLADISTQAGLAALSTTIDAADAANPAEGFRAAAADLEDLARCSVAAAEAFAAGIARLKGNSLTELAEITGRISEGFEAAGRITGAPPAEVAELIAASARKDASGT